MQSVFFKLRVVFICTVIFFVIQNNIAVANDFDENK
jgi:hypothetical protein